MKIDRLPELLSFADRRAWRQWLEKNHRTKKEIWLVYYKKHTGKPSIGYNDAVEEALCFGWIDTTVRRLDPERYLQKFTPRQSGSHWSASNVRRVKKMIARGLMTEAGLKRYNEIKTGKAKRVPRRTEIPAPTDLRTALAKNKPAEDNFNRFAPSHRKMYI